MTEPVVNHTIAELNKLSLNLSNKIRGSPDLKMKTVTVILPDREAEGPIQVSIDIVQYQADQLIKIWQNKAGIPLPDKTQIKVNNLYNGLVNAINLAPAAPVAAPVAAPRPQVQAVQRPAPSRRGGKYSKRRNTKRRNTKRRRNTRK